MLAVKMNASEPRVPSYTNESLELVEHGAEHPLGVSALVSRLNCQSSVGDAGSQASPETEGCGTEEKAQEKNFPWLNSFSKQCRAAIGSKSMKQLDDLLSAYIEHVTPHYRDCHKLPNKAAKLKRNINDTMIFFHMLYMDIREPIENSFYYDKMTELMAMYLDLEITAARRGKDTEKTVTNKLSTSLYTFLDYSEDHILDALLKTKLINKHSKKVCVPLLRKILSELVVRRPLAELTYVRFLLSFKLWKNVVADVEERRAINKLAVQRLHPPPEYFLDHEIARCHTEVLPRIPKSKKNCTLFYLGAKFSVKDACRVRVFQASAGMFVKTSDYINMDISLKALFRYCKDTCRSNVYRRNLTTPEEVEKPFTISSRTSARNMTDVEEGGSCSLINDIWSTISNGESSCFLEESDMFNEAQIEEKTDSVSLKKKRQQPDSPDSRIDTIDKTRRKDSKKKKETSVPDPKFVMMKTEGAADPLSASSAAKGVQDCCLGSAFMMEQVNKVGVAQTHVKVDPCESEMPTSSRQHSVLEALVYVQPGSDNEAVASSSVSPDAGSVPPSHLDTNECDSSVEILQSRQVPTDVSLPLDLKPALNMDGKVPKEDLLLFSGNDPAADEGAVYDSFSEFGMFRLNDDIFNCRSFEGMDQTSMMYRRADVTGSLPFQGSPLLEEDEDEFSKFRWSSVPDFSSVQSTIINQSSGTGSTADLSSCYAGVDSKASPEGSEEPKLGQDVKSGKGASQGMLWQTVMMGGKVMRVRSDELARYISHMRARAQSRSQTQMQIHTQTQAQMRTQCQTQSVSQPQPQPHLQLQALSLSQSQTVPQPIAKTTSSSPQDQTPPPPPPKVQLPPPSPHPSTPLSSPQNTSSNLILEASDNLKILAEEAVRVREASVAEAKCKSDLAANLNLPLKKRKSIPPVCEVMSNGRMVNGQSSYPSAPMISIAQVQGISKSVIVMNSQYSWPSAQTAVPVKSNCVPSVSVSEDFRDCNPIDMSASKNHVQSVGVGGTSIRLDTHCKHCKQTKCQGRCQDLRRRENHCCNSHTCMGECKNVKQVSNYKRAVRGLNGILKTTSTPISAGMKCPACQFVNCGGRCQPSSSSFNDGMKTQKVTFQETTKTVLKCIQCKSTTCSGKCMTSHSRCSVANSNTRKMQRCALCKVSSCNGSCKSSELKCLVCLSPTCEGTCYLTGRSTNNSLSTVSDFSILNSSAFTDKKLKCHACKNNCCGRCKNATGFKYCPYCTSEMYNGSNINHSITSILGASSKSKPDVTVSAQKRKAPTSSRRTRSSAAVSKQNIPTNATINDTQSFTVEDSKRRKKSLPKPVAR
ncbi:Titin-like protein [Frankliniella fusca]|uniref:Titin-like protein n=1 Tax=Frankliniella fusca TaxID=407009 RepID=A0AAE1HY15_9NEOP|nr:Titin-like protein [Frankliniella fusca]